MATDLPAVTFDYGTHLTHIYNDGRREDVPKAAGPCRVCATIIAYDIDPRHIGFSCLLASTDKVGTTDYVIGVDTKSVAGTADWLRRRLPRAIVFEFDWRDDFAWARNQVLDRVPAECDWWFWVDLDDSLEMLDGSSLPDFLSSLPPYVGLVRAAYITRDRDGVIMGGYEREQFFRRSVGARWQDAVHETVRYTPGTVECSTRVVSHRHERFADPARFVPTGDRNRRIIAGQLEREPNRADLWRWLAFENFNAGSYAEATRAYRRAKSGTPADAHPSHSAVLCALSACYAGELDIAAEMVGVATREHPDWPESLIAQGLLLLEIGDYQRACEALEAARARFAENGSGFGPWHVLAPYFYRTLPHVLLASAYGALGDQRRASDNIEAALISPAPAPTWQHDLLVQFRSEFAQGRPVDFSRLRSARG